MHDLSGHQSDHHRNKPPSNVVGAPSTVQVRPRRTSISLRSPAASAPRTQMLALNAGAPKNRRGLQAAAPLRTPRSSVSPAAVAESSEHFGGGSAGGIAAQASESRAGPCGPSLGPAATLQLRGS
jgi:hypothetical protein